jgi:NAD(P)-dependent dehydrogenase (short-subunit alcohol dehydrogenase family)
MRPVIASLMSVAFLSRQKIVITGAASGIDLTAASRFMTLDGLFPAAGIDDRVTTALELTLDDWQRIVDTNLKGTFLTVWVVVRAFVH